MKTIGMIGGITWESTAEYYRIINKMVNAELGGYHSAKIILHSVDFAEIKRRQVSGEWDGITEMLIQAAKGLEGAGADLLVIATNTLHKVADEVQAETRLPLVHIVDAVAEQIQVAGMKKVGLLSTGYTMAEDFYTGRLREKHGLDVLLPDAEGQQVVHDIIFNELVHGQIVDTSRDVYKKIIADLATQGAEGVILGCTEIPLLIKEKDVLVPVFDTTMIHAAKAVEVALKG